MLVYDALRMSFRELKLRRDPDCPVCGTHPTVTELIDYEQFCGVAPGARPAAPAAGTPSERRMEITSIELKARLDRGRRPRAARRARAARDADLPDLDGSTLIPLGEVPRRLEEIDRAARTGRLLPVGRAQPDARSMFLRRQGFDRAL